MSWFHRPLRARWLLVVAACIVVAALNDGGALW